MLYPIAIEKGNETEAFGVAIPDFPGCYSAGDTFAEALKNAKEAIELHLEALAEAEELPPLASAVDELYHSEEYQGWVWALVEIDVEPYMGKASKINVTLPNLLTKKIDEFVILHAEYKSRSHFLQLAAANEFKHHCA